MEQITRGFFGRCIGRTAGTYDGLNAIYLPTGIRGDFADSIVREANLVRPGSPPFAILIADEVPAGATTALVSRSEALRYRQGDRLAVIPATSVDIASFDGSFREAIGPGFPTTGVPGFDVHSLSGTAANLLVSDSGGLTSDVDIDSIRSSIDGCLRKVAELLAIERDGAASWNRAWFESVDRGLGAFRQVLISAMRRGSDSSYEELANEYLWAAFALPRPIVPGSPKESGKHILQALEERWSSEERIALFTKEISVSEGSGKEALKECSTVGWSGLDDAIIRQSSAVTGLQEFLTADLERLMAFSRVTEDVFCGGLMASSPARVLTSEGEDAGLAPGSASDVVVFASVADQGAAISDLMTVSLPLLETPSPGSEAKSVLKMRALGSGNVAIDCSQPRLVGDRIEFSLRVGVPLKSPLKLRRVVLEIDVRDGEALYGYLRSQSVAVHILPPVHSAVVVAQWTSATKANLRTPVYVGQDFLPDTVEDESSLADEPSYREDVKPDTAHRVAFFSKGVAPTTSSFKLGQSARQGCWVGDLPANTPAELRSGAEVWQLETSAPSEAPQSLLLAAMAKVSVAPTDPPTETLVSLRGQLESLFADRSLEPQFLNGLGHVVLPTDQSIPMDSPLVLRPPVNIPVGIEDKWAATPTDELPSAGWESLRQEFVRDWQACVSHLGPVDENGPEGSVLWPSKRSLLPLSDAPELLADMLTSYAVLVDSAHSESPLTRFASTFPFSASGWRLNGGAARCEVVLLSPWHPLRMAWLAAVENTLYRSDRARSLVGSIEGWKFPITGPAPTRVGRMIAVPIEAGENDVFAAWSMLVPLSMGDEEPLKTPAMMAGLTMPGSSASGLTGSAADAAMRDFRRVNGHLTSVTIDLASATESQRMAELDQSVVSALESWSKGAGKVTGISVRDSLNRRGDLPRTQVNEKLRSGLGSSLSWSRYEPDPGVPVKSNLRLLQDSGVQLGFEFEGGDRNGVLGEIPLRRFEVSTGGKLRRTVLQPGISGANSPFAIALRAVEERRGEAPAVNVSMKESQLTDDHADWSISGESFVSASFLAESLSGLALSGGPKRMLWEWRPPFLRPRTGSPLNRRPYASVMRVGRQLTDRINDELRVIDTKTTACADDVFVTLGAQGIGLSSLLAMGGTHSSGALGFYLALRLMDLAQPDDETVQVVMPIDACREFLDVLAPDSRSAETRRQADLLVLRANRHQLWMIPLEVKSYGLTGIATGGLPGPGTAFKEPLDQLAATVTLLGRLQKERRRLGEEGTGEGIALWDNALATLLEAGLRLTYANSAKSKTSLEALQSVVSGDYKLSVGRPLIAFFQHDADAVDQYQAHTPGDPSSTDIMGAYGALAARTRPVLTAVGPGGVPEEGKGLVRAWGNLVDWAQEHAVGWEIGPKENALDAARRASVDAEQEDAPDEMVVPRREALIEQTDQTVEALNLIRETSAVSTNEDPSIGASRGDHELAQSETAGCELRISPLTNSAESKTISVDAPTASGSDDPEKPDVESQATEDPVLRPGQDVDALSGDGVRFKVGSFQDSVGKAAAEYWPSNTNSTQLNLGIVGDLGTGKTQLLKSLLVSLRHSARSNQRTPLTGLVFDYKRDFQDQEFIDAVGARVWRPHLIPLNVLDLHGEYSQPAAFKRASGFASMLERIYSGIGPVQRDKLISVILQLFREKGGRAPTLHQVLERYREETPSDSITSILNSFVLSEIFSEDETTLVSLELAMHDTILVVDLNSFGADHRIKNALVVLFLDMFYEAMKRSRKHPFLSNDQGVTLRQLSSFLLVDEASNIMEYNFPVLESLLKEGREFGVGTILSSQYLSHFKSKNMDFAETLSTWFIHKVPNVTANQLSSLGIVGSAQMMADKIRTLGVHESLFKSDLSEARFIREIPFWQQMKDENLKKY